VVTYDRWSYVTIILRIFDGVWGYSAGVGRQPYRNNLRLNRRAYADFKRQQAIGTIAYVQCKEKRAREPR